METEFYTSNSCIQTLSATEQDELFRTVRILDFKAGELIIKKGTAVHDLFLLQEGAVELSMDEEQPKRSLMLLFPGEIVGVNCAYSTMYYRFSARALTNCKVTILDYGKFSKLLKSNSDFSMAFIQYISNVNESFLDWHMKLTEKNSAGALAFLFCEFQKSYGQSTFDLPLTRKDIARVIGFSRESVLKNMAHFRGEGILESSGKTIKILDLDRLNDISNYG